MGSGRNVGGDEGATSDNPPAGPATAMQTLGWGIALVILGLLLTFTHLFGFVVGFPLLAIGVVLIVVGVILGIVHFFTGATRAGRMRGRTI